MMKDEFQMQFPGVIESVAEEFDCRPRELLAGGRLSSRNLSEARAVAAWVAYQTGTVSFPVLGRMLGMKYPATRVRVMAVARRREREPRFNELCERLAGRPKAGKRAVSA